MEKLKTLWSKTNRWHRGLVIFLIIELKVLPGGQMGFTCNDPALSHPFTGDTITWKHLMGVVVFLPLAVMLLVERTYHQDKSDKPKKQALRWYKEYLYGVLLNLLVVQSIKLVVGSPRPHFFDTCSPNEALTCKGIRSFVQLHQGTLAEPVGQELPVRPLVASFTCGVFLAYYLYRRATRSSVILSTQAVLLLSVVYCCVSRMLDHRHHWWDVLCGAGLGVPILLYTYRMHGDIADYPNRAFYGGRVTSAAPPRPRLPLPPYTILSISSGDKRQGASGANEMEAWGVSRLVVALSAVLRPLALSLAVITPYNAHKDLIKKNLKQLQGRTSESPVEVNTVDSFQGQERDVVVVSLARSHGVGFLTDAGRMNVMLTRAKHALVICLNPHAMVKNYQWRTLIEDAQKRKMYVSLPNDMCQPVSPGQIASDDILKYLTSTK